MTAADPTRATVPDSIPLKCRCGAVRGEGLQPRRATYGVCYCDDCQAYAHALKRADTLDDKGGTAIWQTAPSRVRLTAGAEHVRCLRLSDKGMFRFHTGCCDTPIGNTMGNARLPFVGVPTAFIDLDPDARDAALGLPQTHMQARFATAPVPGGHNTVSPVFLARAGVRLLGGLLTGAHQPSPYWTPAGEPVSTPRVLSASERSALTTGPATAAAPPTTTTKTTSKTTHRPAAR